VPDRNKGMVSGKFWRATVLMLLPFSGSAIAQTSMPALFPAPPTASSQLTFFEVASQPLSEALIAFALQGNISIGLDDVVGPGTVSPRLSGLYTTAEGLRLLLSGSGNTFAFVDDTTVRVFQAQAMPAPRPTRQVRPQNQRRVDRGQNFALEELIVTSTKRREPIQDVPMSVASIPAERLQDLDVRESADLMPLVAGLSMTNLGPGRNKIFLRGQSDGPLAERTQSTVGVYIDESPLVFSDTNPDFRLIDVERVEVLRGPQGTLFGAGSLGGTYRIITNKPDPQGVSGQASLQSGLVQNGDLNYAADAVLNVPLVRGQSALRAAAFYDRYGGFIDDTTLGIDNVNDTTIYGGRLSYLTDIGDRWSLLVSANAQKIDLDDTQYFSPEVGVLLRSNLVPEPRTDRVFQTGAVVTGDLRWGEFTSATTFVNRRITNQSDASTAVPDLLGLTVRPSPFTSRDKIRTLIQEMRLAQTGSRLDWVVGAFYLTRTQTLKTSYIVPGAGDAFAAAGFPSDEVFAEDRDDDVKEYAIFGDASLRLTRRWEVSGGLRLSRGNLDVSSLTTGVVNGRIEEVDLANAKTSVTPRYSVSYRPNEEQHFYVQAANGFRIGGVNINTPISALFDPDLNDDEEDEDEVLQTQTFSEDSLWSYEAGLKARLFDNRLELDLAAFFVQWKNIQTDQVLPTGFLFVTNAGNAENYGLELQAAAHISARTTITAAAIWNDPQLLEANVFLNAERGDRLPAIARFSGSMSVTHVRPVGRNLDVRLSADYSYVGRSSLFFDRDQSPSMGDFHRVNIRAGIESEHWQALVSVTNLTNSRGNTFAYGNSFSLNATSQFNPTRPRTVSLGLVRTF